MAWYAKVENDKVIDVVFVVDTLDSNWLYRELGGTWLKCAEDGSIRNVFPAVGFNYSKDDDEFMLPQPYASWSFDRSKKNWIAPVERPQDGKQYKWDESAQQWTLSQIA